MKMRKLTLSSLLAIFLLSTVLASPGVSAASLTELQKEQKMLEEKKTNLNVGIQEKNTELSTNKSSIESIEAQIKTLNAKVNETEANINRVEAEIAETTEEIDALYLSITELEIKIAERDEVLKDRVRAMQVTGGTVNYLDVMLRANSFSDFIDRFSAVTTLLDADRNIMTQQAEDIAQLEVEKALVEQKLAEQVESKSKLEGLKASLESQKTEKDKLVKQLEAKQQEINAEKKNLETTYEETHEISKSLENEIVAEQTRMAEIARKAAAEKQAKAKAQAQAQAQAQAKSQSQSKAQSKSHSNNSSASNSGGNSSAPSPSISSGSWTKPANGRSSSGFGWRIHPISGVSKQHRGADIANSTGTPIVAAGDGIVSRTGVLGTYGNIIMITHVVNGQTYTTLYAHLSSIGVSTGQQVSKGQLIGRMGSTGGSTGPHLHFEFHIGYYSGYGPSAVNPRNYVPM